MRDRLILAVLLAAAIALPWVATALDQPATTGVATRIACLAIAAVSLPALLLKGATARRVLAGAGVLLAGAGMAAALWQHFVSAASGSCKLTLADRIVAGLGLDGLWPEVFAAYASCADAAVKLLGVWYEFYSLGLFALLALVGLRLLRRPA